MSEPIYINLRGLLDDHLARLSKLPPAVVLAYLAGADWGFYKALKNGDVQVWAKYDTDGHIIASVGVPMVRGAGDYEERRKALFRTVAVIEEWPMSVSLGLPAELQEVCGE